MRELHLFAGAGGGILGGILLGHTCVCAVEIEPYCRKVLLQRQRDGILPRFPIWDDVKTFDGRPWCGLVDVVCGGFPCQDISACGKGEGISGERSGLWSEFARIISEIQPAFVWVENSPMLTSRGLGVVLGDFSELGYDALWGVVSAADAGAPHLRERIWIRASMADSLPARKRGEPRQGKTQENPAWIDSHSHDDRSQGRWQGRTQCQGGPWTEQQFAGLVESEIQLSIPAGKDKRMADGLANRMDRLKSVGNGQVPAVVRLAWETLTK